MYYVALLIMVVACQPKEPAASCKTMDTATNRCLDGAQPVSAPATAQGGLSAEDMAKLVAAMQSQQTTRLNTAAASGQTVGQFIQSEEQYCTRQLIEWRSQRQSAAAPESIRKLDGDIQYCEARLEAIEEAKPGIAGEAWGMTLDYCRNNPASCGNGVKEVVEWGWKTVVSVFSGGGSDQENAENFLGGSN